MSSFLSPVDIAFAKEPGKDETPLPFAQLLAAYPNHPACHFGLLAERLRGTKVRPHRSQFHPSLCPSLLPWMIILGCEPHPDLGQAFRYKLTGKGVRAMFGETVVGRLMHEVLPEPFRSERQKLLTDVIARGAAYFSLRRVPRPDRAFLSILIGIFPFDADTDADTDADPRREVFIVTGPADLAVTAPPPVLD